MPPEPVLAEPTPVEHPVHPPAPGSKGDTESKPSKLEALKAASRQLRGTILDEFQDKETDHFTGDAGQLLKHHGTYQQDDRDLRNRKDADGNKLGKHYMMMVRSAVPGGRITAAQLLAELDLADKYGDGTLRITTRQGVQHHGILKDDLKATIRGINEIKLSTYAACGDVSRNVMCCPAPGDAVKTQMQEHAQQLADHLRPKSLAYYDLWLDDGEGNKSREGVEGIATDGEKTGGDLVDEPIYGDVYLPRKFKVGIALPEDNSVDLLTQDLGYLAVVEDGQLVGYDVWAGGGMGVTPAKKETEPLLAKRLCFVTPDQVCDIATAVVKVQRDHGNRNNRKIARMKYLIRHWGIEKFTDVVNEYYKAEFGRELTRPRGIEITDSLDHSGWQEHEAGTEHAGKLWLGLNVENGRVKDEGDFRLKTALRVLLTKYPVDCRLTALQSLIFVGIDPASKEDVESILRSHGVPLPGDVSVTRSYSMACPAIPTCGLAVTDSERVMPDLVSMLEAELESAGLAGERITMHMTGCPNGCARPYTPEIGLVGKAKGRYTLYLGGDAAGNRLGFIYDDLVPFEEIPVRLRPLLTQYREERTGNESFGDWCARMGESLPEPAKAA